MEPEAGAVGLSWAVLPDDARVNVMPSRGDVRIRIPFGATPSGRLSTRPGFIRSAYPGPVNDAGDAVALAGDGPHFEVETASGDVVFEKDPGWFAPERQATPSTEAEATGPE